MMTEKFRGLFQKGALEIFFSNSRFFNTSRWSMSSCTSANMSQTSRIRVIWRRWLRRFHEGKKLHLEDLTVCRTARWKARVFDHDKITLIFALFRINFSTVTCGLCAVFTCMCNIVLLLSILKSFPESYGGKNFSGPVLVPAHTTTQNSPFLPQQYL